MKMEIWCGRSSDNYFRIRLIDAEANVEFASVKITPENFAYMLANQPVECEGEVCNLNRVGKTRVFEQRSAIYTGKDASKQTVRRWLIESHKGDGWEINDTLSSQNSIVFRHPDYYIVNYTVEKWI